MKRFVHLFSPTLAVLLRRERKARRALQRAVTYTAGSLVEMSLLRDKAEADLAAARAEVKEIRRTVATEVKKAVAAEFKREARRSGGGRAAGA